MGKQLGDVGHAHRHLLGAHGDVQRPAGVQRQTRHGRGHHSKPVRQGHAQEKEPIVSLTIFNAFCYPSEWDHPTEGKKVCFV